MGSLVALMLAGFLPGILLVDWCIGDSRRPSWFEQCLYAIGAGYTIIISGMLLLAYIPGPIERLHSFLLFLAIDLFLIAAWLTRRWMWLKEAVRNFSMHRAARSIGDAIGVDGHTRWFSVALVALVAVVIFFRFTNLGYSEFQGDEAVVALRAAEAIQGYDNALFVHRKGPAEILVAALVYSLTGSLTEFDARLPFAIANAAGVMAIFVLSRSLIGLFGGLFAAMLLALDGYLIAFSRILQYQSLVFLMVVLSVLVLYRLARQPISLTGRLILVGLYAASGLLAHYEAIFLALPGGYLLWQISRRVGMATLARALVVPTLVGASMLMLFYVPFVLNPAFDNTFWYLISYRVGGAPESHGVRNVFARTTLYNTTYYLFLLIVLTLFELVSLYWRHLPRRYRAPLAVLVAAVILLTLAYPIWLSGNNQRLVGVLFAVALAVAWVLPGVTQEERLIWLWYGGTTVVALFFTARPNTHVYNMFIPWALVAGLAAQQFWRKVSRRHGAVWLRPAFAAVTLAFLAFFATYAYWYFVHNEVEVLRTWPENRPRNFWVPYEEPVEIAIFGFPLKNGWKTVASLYEMGELEGAFATNARPAVADWYTRGRGPCPRDDPAYFMLVHAVEPTLADERSDLRRQLEEKYKLHTTVRVNGEPHMEIFQRKEADFQAQTLDEEDYAEFYDEHLLDANFARNGPAGDVSIEYATDYRLRNGMWLRGFAVEREQVQAGDDLVLVLYWQATQPIEDDYFVSVQAIDTVDLHKAGQRDGEPGCNEYPTSIWRPGDLISDHYRVPIAEDAQPGAYTVLLTVYTEQGSVEVVDGAGNPAGVSIPLTEIEVMAPSGENDPSPVVWRNR